MEKLVVFFLVFGLLQSGEIDGTGAASIMSLGAPSFILVSPVASGLGVLVAPSVISEKLSYKNAVVENRYKHFEKLMAQGKFRNIKAGEIFDQQEMYLLSLNEEDDIIFDNISIGILVSSADNILFIVPSENKYSDVFSKEIR